MDTLRKIFKYVLLIYFIAVLVLSIVRLVDLKNYKVDIDYNAQNNYTYEEKKFFTNEDGNTQLKIYPVTYLKVFYKSYKINSGNNIKDFHAKYAIIEYQIIDQQNNYIIDTFTINTAENNRYTLPKIYDYAVENAKITISRTLIDSKVDIPPQRTIPYAFLVLVSLFGLILYTIDFIHQIKQNKLSLQPVKDDLYNNEH